MDFYSVEAIVVKNSKVLEAAIDAKIEKARASEEYKTQWQEVFSQDGRDDIVARAAATAAVEQEFISGLEYEKSCAFEDACNATLGKHAGLFLNIVQGLSALSEWPTKRLSAEGWKVEATVGV